MNKTVFLIISLFIVTLLFGQQKKYNVVVAGFYNLENLFDTIDAKGWGDDDFTPNGTNHYSPEIYLDKLDHLEDVVALIGTDVSPDGMAFWGTAEIENAQVVQDLVNMPKLKNRNYSRNKLFTM